MKEVEVDEQKEEKKRAGSEEIKLQQSRSEIIKLKRSIVSV